MFEEFASGVTLPEAYHNALCNLKKYGTESDCSDWNTKQLECSMTIQVIKPLQEPMISKLFIGGPVELEQYRQEMLDGILDFEIYAGKWKYTYHDRMVNYPTEYDVGLDQLAFVVKELKRNPSSRRAVVIIRDVGADIRSDDPACLQHIQYFIRAGKLHCKVLFRSNDACKATFMNAFALIMLQKRIADELGIEIGTYTHRANSFHCYEKDYDMLDGYVSRIKNSKRDDLCFDYQDDWKEDMDAADDLIKKKVEELRSRSYT